MFSHTRNVYYIFPEGKFDFSYCKAEDFNLKKEKDKFTIHFFVYKFLRENPEWAIKNYDKFLNSPEFKTYDELSKWLDDREKISIYSFGIHPYNKSELENGVKNLPNLISNTNIQEAKKNKYETWINPKNFYKFTKSFVDKLNIEK